MGNGVFLTPGGTCRPGPNTSGGFVQTAQGTAFDPNGGYYYARISFNF